MSFRQPNNAGSCAELEIELTEEDLRPSRIDNIASVHLYRNGFIDLNDLAFSLLASILINALERGSGSLCSTTHYYDRYLNLPRGTSLSVIRHLLANRLIRITMLKPINLEEPLTLQLSKSPTKNDHRMIEMVPSPTTNEALNQPNADQSQEADTSESSNSARKIAVKRSVGPNAKGVVEKVSYKVNHDLIDLNLVQAKE